MSKIFIPVPTQKAGEVALGALLKKYAHREKKAEGVVFTTGGNFYRIETDEPEREHLVIRCIGMKRPVRGIHKGSRVYFNHEHTLVVEVPQGALPRDL